MYFKCPTTKQMRCPVNAYADLAAGVLVVSMNEAKLKTIGVDPERILPHR
jgi:hypothetical protein